MLGVTAPVDGFHIVLEQEAAVQVGKLGGRGKKIHHGTIKAFALDPAA
jgi:hypothetical protein